MPREPQQHQPYLFTGQQVRRRSLWARCEVDSGRIRAEFLRELVDLAKARQADERAPCLTANPAEHALVEQRLA